LMRRTPSLGSGLFELNERPGRRDSPKLLSSFWFPATLSASCFFVLPPSKGDLYSVNSELQALSAGSAGVSLSAPGMLAS
jgi:hypothetical protein